MHGSVSNAIDVGFAKDDFIQLAHDANHPRRRHGLDRRRLQISNWSVSGRSWEMTYCVLLRGWK